MAKLQDLHDLVGHAPGIMPVLCKSFCKASASMAKLQDLHDLVGHATGIMPVYWMSAASNGTISFITPLAST